MRQISVPVGAERVKGGIWVVVVFVDEDMVARPDKMRRMKDALRNMVDGTEISIYIPRQRARGVIYHVFRLLESLEGRSSAVPAS